MDNSLKDRVLESIDIVDVIGERVDLTRRGREYVGLCPFHADHNPSLSVSPSKQIFKCWSCGAGGDVIRFVQLIDRVDFPQALATLARRAGIEMHRGEPDRRNSEQRSELLAVIRWARDHFRKNLAATNAGERARQYALQRGLTEETIERFSLGFAPDAWDDVLTAASETRLRVELLHQAGLVATSEHGKTYDRFRNRLIFPIADALGRPIAFGGRTLGDDPAKYLNSPETPLFSKSRILFGFDQARRTIEATGAVVVVEGYMDAVLLAQHGVEYVVATLGTALTDAHLKLLTPIARTLYLCFDSDDAGVRAADRAVELALRSRADVRVVLLEAGQDPADCVLAEGADGFRARLTSAIDALEFKWSQAFSSFRQADNRDRRAAIEEFVRFVAGVVAAGALDPLQENLLVNRLSELLGVPPDDAFDLLASAKRGARRAATTQRQRPDAESSYDQTIRGLSGGLAAAVESILGLLLIDPACWEHVDDTVSRGAGHSETWRHLYGVLVEVHRDMGEYSIGDVIERCDDSAVCELVGRARARVDGVATPTEAFCAARERLQSELDVLKMSNLYQNLHEASDCADAKAELFGSLRRIAGEQHSVLPAENRWRSGPVRS